MKSMIPLSAVTLLAALALVGCSESSPTNSSETPSSHSRMSETNGMMGGTNNMPATNNMPNMKLPANTNTTGAANDATR
jgi:hypothetical protein